MKVYPDHMWLALALISEDNEPHAYLPLAWVIRNRVESRRYPNTYREVVTQPSQFSAFNGLPAELANDFEKAAAFVLKNQPRECDSLLLDDGPPLGSLAEEAAEASILVAQRLIRRIGSPFSRRVLFFFAPGGMEAKEAFPWWWDKEVHNTIRLPGLTRWVFGEVAK